MKIDCLEENQLERNRVLYPISSAVRNSSQEEYRDRVQGMFPLNGSDT